MPLNVPLIGEKGLDSIEPFCAPELMELFKGMDGTLSQGVPPNVPAAIPLIQLARIIASLKRYRDVAHRLVEESKKTGVEDGPMPDYESVVAQAKALLEVGPPKPRPSSRLVLPR